MKQHKVCGYPDNKCDAKYDFRGICCCGGENENSCDCALLSGHFVSVHLYGENAYGKSAKSNKACPGVSSIAGILRNSGDTTLNY